MMTDKPKAKAKPKAKEQKNYFSEKELRCKHSGEYFFDEDFLNLLNKIREECGFPLRITSGYRSEQHPTEARKIRFNKPAGSHNKGKAVDVGVTGEKALKLIEVAMNNGITRIGINQKGDSRFIHLDVCKQSDFPEIEHYPEVAIWSY